MPKRANLRPDPAEGMGLALSRLIYFSENQIEPRQGSILPALSGILRASNRNNRMSGLTGALIFDEQWFVQVLEGEHLPTWRTFERLRDDDRHADAVIVEFAEAKERVFANWWMGLATRSGRTEAIFAPFLVDGRFDPRAMRAAQLLTLAIELSALGLARELATPATTGVAS